MCRCTAHCLTTYSFSYKYNGRHFSLNTRRLYCFQAAGIGLAHVRTRALSHFKFWTNPHTSRRQLSMSAMFSDAYDTTKHAVRAIRPRSHTACPLRGSRDEGQRNNGEPQRQNMIRRVCGPERGLCHNHPAKQSSKNRKSCFA